MGVSGSQGKASGRKQGRLEDGLEFKENVAGKKWTSGSRGGCPGQGAGPVPRTSGLFAGGSDRRNSMKFAEETGKIAQRWYLSVGRVALRSRGRQFPTLGLCGVHPALRPHPNQFALASHGLKDLIHWKSRISQRPIHVPIF